MAFIIGTRNLSNKIYQLTGNPLQWSDFPSQPPGGIVGYGIWGGPNNTIWTHNGRSDSQKRFLFFDGTSWSEYTQGDDIPGGYYDPIVIYGSENGQYVYAGSENAIQRWSGGPSWTTVLTGYSAGSIWCDSTGQYVWATYAGLGNPQNHILVSSNYGISWSNVVLDLVDVIDAYVPGSVLGWSGTPRGVKCSSICGISTNEIYIGVGFNNTNPAYGGIVVAKWNGTEWSIVTANVGGVGSVENAAQQIMWSDGTDYIVGGIDGGPNLNIFKNYSGFLQRDIDSSTWGYILRRTNGKGVIKNDNDIVLIMNAYNSGDPARCIITDDVLTTWTESNRPWGNDPIGIDAISLYGWIPNAQPLDWYFETGNPPFIESRTPSSDSNGIEFNTSIIFDVVDAESYVRTDMIDAYVNDALAFSGPNTFISPYNGPGSSITFISNGSIDGYDAYRVVLDKTTEYDFNSINSVRCTALDYGYNEIDETWYFHTGSLFFDNQDPYNEVRVSFSNKQMKLDVISAQAAASSYIDAYVDGVLAFSNETFYSPFDGPDAYFGNVNVDGYDGYRIILDNSNDWSSYQTIIIDAYAEDAYGFVASETWSFRIQDIYSPKYKVSSVFPQSNAVNVNPNTNIKIDIYDEDSGIDPTTIDAYLNEVLIYNGATDSFNSGYDGSVVEVDVDGYDGYRVTIDKIDPYNSGQRIAVKIYAKDNEGN